MQFLLRFGMTSKLSLVAAMQPFLAKLRTNLKSECATISEFCFSGEGERDRERVIIFTVKDYHLCIFKVIVSSHESYFLCRF